MTILDIHILLEQSLQNMTGFVYEDMEKEEFDNALNTKLYDIIDDIVRRDRRDPESVDGYEGDVLTLQDLANLTIPNSKLTISEDTSELNDVIISNLPEEHFLSVAGKLVYKPSFIKPCNNPYTGKVSSTATRGIFRIAEHKNIDNYLEDENNKTTIDSIVVARAGKKLYIYTNGRFTKENIDKCLLTYVKNPPKIEFGEDGSEEYDMPQGFIYHLIHETAIFISKVKDDEKKSKLLSSEDIR